MMDKIPLPNSNPTNEDESSETEDDSVPVFNPQHPKFKSVEDKPLADLKPVNDTEAEKMPYFVPSPVVVLKQPRKQVFRSEVTFGSLAIAVQDHDINKLEMMLAEDNVNFVDVSGLNILHVAMCWGNDEVLKVLLDHPRSKALINTTDEKGMTPLMYAVRYNKSSAVKLLCSYDADTAIAQRRKGDTALHYAARAEDYKLAEILVKYNSTPEFVNYINIEGETALTNAIQYNSPALDLILDCGADYTKPNKKTGRTVLHIIIANNRIATLKKILLKPESTKGFLDKRDYQGDSALMLAVRLGQLKLIEILTQHIPEIFSINETTYETLLHIAISQNRPDILSHLLPYMSEFVLNYPDANGRTPLIYAVELDYINCLNVMLEYGVDVKESNPKNGETILHTTVRAKSISVLERIMKLDCIKYFFNKKDKNGNTPHMAAINAGNAVCLKKFLKAKWIDLSERNKNGDTPMYYAVKHGFLNILHALLLSSNYYSFCNTYESKFDIIDEQTILNAEIRGEIYASDVYILLDKKIKYELVSWFPSSVFLRSKQNRNIFHACALGGNLKCLEFLYNYFTIFNQNLNDFDESDNRGNTPLLLAVQCSHIKCVQFFLKHYANLSVINNDKLNAVKAIKLHIPQHTQLFINVLDNCIVKSSYKSYDSLQNLGLNFKILCPKNENQMKVITLLFETIESGKILEHPILRAFLHLKWKKSGQIFVIRFILSLISTLILTSFLTIKISQFFTSNSYSKLVYKTESFLIFFFSTIGLCFAIPQLTFKSIWYVALLTYTLTLLPSLATFTLVFLNNNFPFINEICALAILTSWFSLIMYSINIFLGVSLQVAMFSNVMFRILKHFIVFLFILIAFSFSFFCIFNDDKKFANPFISFMYTSIIILPGNMNDLPIFTTRHPSKNIKYGEFIIECIIVLMFLLTAMIGLVNMLVGIAVQGGHLLERDGSIFRNHLRIKWLNDLEILYSRKWYSFLEKTYMTYLIGVPSAMKKTRNIALHYSTLQDNNGKLILPDNIFSSIKNVVLYKTKNELKLLEATNESIDSIVKFPKFQDDIEPNIKLILKTEAGMQKLTDSIRETVLKLKEYISKTEKEMITL